MANTFIFLFLTVFVTQQFLVKGNPINQDVVEKLTVESNQTNKKEVLDLSALTKMFSKLFSRVLGSPKNIQEEPESIIEINTNNELKETSLIKKRRVKRHYALTTEATTEKPVTKNPVTTEKPVITTPVTEQPITEKPHKKSCLKTLLSWLRNKYCNIIKKIRQCIKCKAEAAAANTETIYDFYLEYL